MSIPGSEIIAKSISPDRLVSGAIKYKRIITFFEGAYSIAIDSTGTKLKTAYHLLEEQDVAHLKEAYFEVAITDFSATDATVDIVLYNVTDSVEVVKCSVSSDTPRVRGTISIDTIEGLVGKILAVEVRVATASATSGATAVFKAARLILVYEIP